MQLPSTPTPTLILRPNPDLPPRPSATATPQRKQSSASLQVPPSSIASPSKPPLSRPPSPTILSSTAPAIELIHETLYATLADILECQPSLPLLLKSDPPQAYFASVSRHTPYEPQLYRS
ncbi:hypothetical protein JAAARDRAFT_199119 [Jaapia argillacea MUCL 33604]|uniref:Uncharacterized protein n=1 Tax=Jaapia argillacea MUCL 33604 TaxID=933084 RepID=A0A067PCD9_9AGAM|nr:hypothetical protein JAAARDRAFT_199119 [Jaapia argillacea MUCL 33604]